MRLTLRQLQIFAAVARSGSTTAAAADVARSQSATSAAINELEAVLGVQLFDRVARRLVLNDNGRGLLPAALALIEQAQEIEDGFRLAGGAPQANLRIAASTTIGNYLLPGLLARLREDWPDARVDVRIVNTREAADAVAAFEADLGLIEGPCQHPDLVLLPCIEDELVIVAAPAHPLARGGRRVGVRALREAGWLMREPGSGTREAVEHALLPHLHRLREDITLGSSEAIKHGVAAGLGLSCLSRSVVQEAIAQGSVVALPTTLPRLTRRFTLIHHRRKRLSAPLQQLLTMCAAVHVHQDGQASMGEHHRKNR